MDDTPRSRNGDENTLKWRNYLLGENLLDALCIIDETLHIVQLNQRWKELVGRDSKDLESMCFTELVDPKDRAEVTDELAACLAQAVTFEMELRLDHVDGRFFWVQLRAMSLPERNLIFLTVHNITPLKTKIGHLDQFFAMLPDLLCIADFEGHFLQINPSWEKLLGWTLKELQEKEFVSFVHPEDREHTRAQYENNREGADTVLFENRYRKKDGTYKWIEWKSVTMIEEQLIFASARDITTRKLMEEKLTEMDRNQAANRAKTVFLAAMSHELRTPLNGIIGSASLAYEEAENPSQKELLSMLKASADSLQRIVEDILDFCKVDAGQIELNPEPFSLRSLVHDIERLYSAEAKQKELEFESRIEEALPDIVENDANRLGQVLRNLIDNAMRFTQQGCITINIARSSETESTDSVIQRVSDEQHQWIRFTVSDTGAGIPEHEKYKIFDVFHQTHEFMNRRVGGMGIGLTISKQLVELMGGQIELSSTLGKGSVFVMDIPFLISAKTTHAKLHEVNLDTPIPSLNILVVEDNVVNQKIVVKFLSKWGHSVVIAENGHLALNAMREKCFDLVLMDLQMPEMDGLTATRKIRAIEKSSAERTPIVAMTAHAAKSDEDACYEAGMDDFIVKPFKPEKLKAVLYPTFRAS